MAAPRASGQRPQANVARYTVSGSIFPDENPVIDNYRIIVCRHQCFGGCRTAGSHRARCYQRPLNWRNGKVYSLRLVRRRGDLGI